MARAASPSAKRAGQYIRQPAGYRAFIPRPLPPRPPIRLAGKEQSLLAEAALALGRLDGAIHTLPNPDLFVLMYVRKEAVLSSQIEGTQSSLQDVLAAEAKVLAAGGTGDAGEVINHIRAMNEGLKRLDDIPVSVRLIREIHATLLSGTRGRRMTPGDLRTSQNWIGPAGCTLQEATFVPPPPHEAGEALSRLEVFLHRPGDLSPLVWIGLAHAQFETIHPFLDGNGRIGRLLITFLLCQQKILAKPVLYLSHFFKQHRQEYYDQLQSVRDRGTWESWLGFFLRGVRDVAGEAARTVATVLALRERHRGLITSELGMAAGNGQRVLEHLYQRPLVAVSDVQALLGVTYAAANNLVARMVDCKILQELTGQSRNRVFGYQSYIQLFNAGTAEPA